MKMNRRQFFYTTLGFSIFASFFSQCKNKTKLWMMKIIGKNHILGHRLWTKNFPIPNHTKHIPVIIIGGGISGLASAWEFIRHGFEDFHLFELEPKVGGNSISGQNKYGRYTLGAHYLPLPNLNYLPLLEFLNQNGIVHSFDNENIVYNDLHISFDPMERIFHKNKWHDGQYVLESEEEQKAFDLFFEKMDSYKKAKGDDLKYFFDIPLHFSSKDTKYDALDFITTYDWLVSNGLNNEKLIEYINYCCRDDYGYGAHSVSAWTMIHYFASRRGSAYTKSKGVLTWETGNAYLADKLAFAIPQGKITKNSIAYLVDSEKKEILIYNQLSNSSIRYTFDSLILATPQYINQYLLPNRKNRLFRYAPWIVSQITIEYIDDNGAQIAWENIISKSKGLGYVNNGHQKLNTVSNEIILTFYYSFEDFDDKKSRKELHKMDEVALKRIVLDDLKIAYPDIEKWILDFEVYVNGHGMVSPYVGFMKNKNREKMSIPIDNNIFFTHSDLSGISIFEEAFFRGVEAAKIIRNGSKS